MVARGALTTHSTSNRVDCLINRLPTELLILLLEFALHLPPRIELRSQYLYRDGHIPYYKHLSLIRLVCKKWRDIIETTSSFWIYISTSVPPILFKKVVRCAPGSRSLHVHYNAGASFARPSQRLAVDRSILQLSEFWTSLHTQFTSLEQLLQLLKQPTPRLRRLHVEHITTIGTYTDVEIGFQTISIPLEILEVKNSIFPWSSSAITNLLEVDVGCSHRCPYFSQGFIDVLRSSPRLQSLRLSFCQTDLQPQIDIILPHLSSIDFAYSPQAAGLFKAIICPSSTKISIRERARSLTTQHPWVVATLNHANFDCTDNVRLDFRPDSEVGICVGNISLILQREGQSYDQASILQFCSDVLKPLSETNGAQVTNLELALQLERNNVPLISKLDSFFPNIGSLELRCYAYDLPISPALFGALSQPFVKEDGRRQWLFPKVEKLRVDWADCPVPLANGVMEIIRSRCSTQGASGPIEGDLSSPRPSRLREFCLVACNMLRSEGQELRSIFGDAVEFRNVWVRNVGSLHS
ncbi:hypothetical protein FRC05_008011 [Tulasnella sp. 425]|nr:hypothetical protein FRC05_008011 [Tulasnella sp. 425]